MMQLASRLKEAWNVHSMGGKYTEIFKVSYMQMGFCKSLGGMVVTNETLKHWKEASAEACRTHDCLLHARPSQWRNFESKSGSWGVRTYYGIGKLRLSDRGGYEK